MAESSRLMLASTGLSMKAPFKLEGLPSAGLGGTMGSGDLTAMACC